MANQADSEETAVSPQQVEAALVEKRGWFLALGILLIALGIGAILFPLATTIAAKIFLGWLFLIGGIAQVVHAFSSQSWKGFIFDLLIGVLYVIVGGWLALFPLTGIIGLTLLLAVTFIVQGLLEIGLVLRVQMADGRFWMMASGIVSLLAGILIWAGLPSTATWAIGLLVGINLISSGWSFVTLASVARRT